MPRDHPACGSEAWVVLDNLIQLVAHGYASQDEAIAKAVECVEDSSRKHYVARIEVKMEPGPGGTKVQHLTPETAQV